MGKKRSEFEKYPETFITPYSDKDKTSYCTSTRMVTHSWVQEI